MESILVKKGGIDFTPSSKVKEITIYSDRALVTRTQATRCSRGESRITFSNLGATIDEQSIKASTSSIIARIVSASLEKRYLYFFKQEEDEETYARMIDVLSRMCALDDNASVYALENRIIADLHGYIRGLLNSLILAQETSIPKFKEALDFCESLLEKNAGSLIDNKIESEKLAFEYGLLKEKLGRIRSLDRKEQNNIIINVKAEEDTDADFELVYGLSGASWRASYDSRADTDARSAELFYYGEIRQSTGENWEKARVVLSTSVSEHSAQIPNIFPVYLGGYFEKRIKDVVVEETALNRLSDISLSDEEAEAPAEEIEERETSVSGEIHEGRITPEKKGIAYTFSIIEPLDIPSDGKWHRGLVMSSGLHAEFYYDTAPRLREYVYLRADVTNMLSIPLLPGSVFVYRNGSYMGRSSIRYIAPDERFSLSFGIDDDLRVKRIELKNLTIPAHGLALKNTREWENHYMLYNFKKTSVKVRVREGIHVSDIKEIEVKVEKDTTPKYKLDEDGIVTWEIELQPDPFKHEKLVLHYFLTAPKDFKIGNV